MRCLGSRPRGRSWLPKHHVMCLHHLNLPVGYPRQQAIALFFLKGHVAKPRTLWICNPEYIYHPNCNKQIEFQAVYPVRMSCVSLWKALRRTLWTPCPWQLSRVREHCKWPLLFHPPILYHPLNWLRVSAVRTIKTRCQLPAHLQPVLLLSQLLLKEKLLEWLRWLGWFPTIHLCISTPCNAYHIMFHHGVICLYDSNRFRSFQWCVAMVHMQKTSMFLYI